ncbi:MAG: ABC transporter substrate-binding protein [Candidatus Paraimprobicoccus trichonymphae]|uniref:ABC transporter substrate-binding protein n=1 Tax=Candidatus Paraimprobicoccus trichonymphae TaxID=3033793 RepID=A0AA48I962_9FIRM|nr:MAG: ABC transporter substrate-binding protein [Candidatus Paraimprobicoccus trichonymphae]
MKTKSKFLILSIIVLLIIGVIFLFNTKYKSNLIRIGIIQLAEHEALDSARNGFIDKLKENGYVDNENIKIDYQNAQGDNSNCNLIASKLVKNSDLILAISTPAAQSVVNLTSKVPILVTAVTDPASANLVKSNEKPGKNVTGTSDLAPVYKQINLIKQLDSNIKRIGILYCSNEDNSKYQADIAIQEARKLDLETQVFTFSQSSEVAQITEAAIKIVDTIYTPTDNLVTANMPTISKIALENKKFVVCGETNVVSKGSIGTYGMDYYKLGKLTAEQAIEILEEKNSTQEMPIKYLEDAKLVLNSEVINKLGIKISENLKKS